MYGGMNFAKYETGAQAEQQITIIVEQTGNDLTVAFNTASGGGGKGVATHVQFGIYTEPK